MEDRPSPIVDAASAALAGRIREERDVRDWSLADLALRSGVSRAMISKIERGEASPTADLLARLATGFGVSLASLFSPRVAVASPLSRAKGRMSWRDPATGYLRRNVSPAGAAAEIVEVEFPAGARVVFDNFRDVGIEQQIWLFEGAMDIAQAGQVWRLTAGDCVLVRLDSPLSFHNPGPEAARYAVVLGQRRVGVSA